MGFRQLFRLFKSTKKIYKQNQNPAIKLAGSKAVAKAYIKELGMTESIFTGIGAIAGTAVAPVVLGSGLVGATIGYGIGAGVVKGCKALSKIHTIFM